MTATEMDITMTIVGAITVDVVEMVGVVGETNNIVEEGAVVQTQMHRRSCQVSYCHPTRFTAPLALIDMFLFLFSYH